MEQRGRLTIVLATLLVFSLETWSCRAQPPARPPATAPLASDDQAVTPKPAPLESIDLPSDRLRDVFSSAGRISLTDRRRHPDHSAGAEPGSTSRPSRRPCPRRRRPSPRSAIPPPRQFGQPSPSTTPTPPRGVGPGAAARPTLSVKLKPAPLEPTDFGLPINLATALRLSDARPLIVAAAQASVWVAEAQLTRAKVLWVPQLNIGGDYIRHDGGGPDFNKGILTAPSVNFFYGGGGLWEIVALTDVFFEPLVKRQDLNSRQADIQTAKNDAAAHDRRRLLRRPPAPRACMPEPSTASSGDATWSSGSPA